MLNFLSDIYGQFLAEFVNCHLNVIVILFLVSRNVTEVHFGVPYC